MEISDSTIGVFYISKLLALAPFSIRKNSKGVLEIRRSIASAFYSVSLILIMIFLTYRGLLFDANSKIPIRRSFRMKSATSKVVTAMDVSVVVLAGSSGVLCGLLGLKSTQDLNCSLRQIDSSLHSYCNAKKDRIRTYALLVATILVISSILGLDIFTWLRVAERMSNKEATAEVNVQWYIPFYSLYYILTGLQINFACTAIGLGRRYRRLNLILKNTFLPDDNVPKKIKLNNLQKTKVVAVKAINTEMEKKNASDADVPKFSINELTGGAKSLGNFVAHLAMVHEALGKCVQNVSSSYGLAVLFVLVSCLLHLVATAYFFFLEFLTPSKEGTYSWLQSFWIIFHVFRLLMIVEPCHMATNEAKKTISIVCQIERLSHDPILDESLNKFWHQLLADKAQFSACGLCCVNRNILTSFSSAIATYLVILIQFQSTNG